MAWWKQRYSIGKVYNQIGYEKNKDVGLVETIYIQIGFEVNKDIGLIGAENYPTPTNNPQSTKRTNEN